MDVQVDVRKVKIYDHGEETFSILYEVATQ